MTRAQITDLKVNVQLPRLETYGKLLTGRKFLCRGSSLNRFNRGFTKASFQACGKYTLSRDRLIICLIT